MSKWKVVLYLSDECAEHETKEECNTPPEWWEGDPEDYDGREEGWCYSNVPEGYLDTKQEAHKFADMLLTYGSKHQDYSFTFGAIEKVE